MTFSRIVYRDGNKLRFVRKANAQAHREFMGMISYCVKENYSEVVLDFSSVTNAYPNGMVPIISSLDLLKRKGIKFDIILPTDTRCNNLFMYTNWAYLLLPDKYAQEETHHNKHLTTLRFIDSAEQQDVVNRFIDVVMRNMDLERSVISGLEWSINEITDNVLNHSKSEDGGIIQISTFPSDCSVHFAIADSGVGILSTLKQSIPSLTSDIHAIGEAVKAGVTRDPSIGQGNGLAGTLRISTMSGGSFSITSGSGHINYFIGDAKKYERRPYESYQGTLICADLKTNSKTFSISEALGFEKFKNYVPVDVIEMNYLQEDGLLHFCVSKETTGLGNRTAGRQLKQKLLNILNAEPTKPVEVDWSGIPLISSSFADEFMGKLFLELGAMTFSARLRNTKMEKLIRDLLDKAIAQRLSQASDEF